MGRWEPNYYAKRTETVPSRKFEMLTESVFTKSIKLILRWRRRTKDLLLVNYLKTDPVPLESSDRFREPR
jgi:hypothetical protein